MRAIDGDELLKVTVKRNSIWNAITNSSGEGLEEIINSQPTIETPKWIPVTECVYKKGDKRCYVRLDAENTAKVSEEAIDAMLNKLGYRLISRLPYKENEE